MDKVKIHEVAKELAMNSKEVLEKAIDFGLAVKSAQSTIKSDEAVALMEFVMSGGKKEIKEELKPTTQKKPPKEEPKPSTKPVAKKDVAPKPSEVKKSVEVVEEPKTTPEIQEKLQGESLAQSTLIKRRGLVIVKKKKEAEVPVKEVVKKEEPKIPSSLESIFSSSPESSEKKKKKVKKPAPAVAKKDGAEKIDLLADRDLGEFSYDHEEEMVVLPDFTVRAEPKNTDSGTKKKTDIGQVVIGRGQKAVTMNQPTSIRRGGKKRPPRKVETNKEVVKSVKIPEEIRVYEFAEMINKQASEIISKLFMLGMMTTKNDFLDKDAIEILADEFGIEVETVNAQEEFDYLKAYDEVEEDTDATERAPVITIMGHVDHGKTSLLDYIRNSRVAHGEHGGITQHVGAYMVNKNGKNITFIDTPGHEAFTQMRARGAEVTDIVIIVVAADDGVKPQTKEAIDHAKAAGVPIIVAINKMDKESANPDMVKTQLSELGIMPTEWGGEHEFVGVSAHTGDGIEELLEIILLQAELLELKASESRDAKAVVIESSLEKGRGPVATVVVQNGTLKVGDNVVAGVAYGKVRALLDSNGKAIKIIKPGEPGVVVGLSEVAEAGEKLVKVASDKIAREYAQKRHEYQRQKELSRSTKVTLDELSQKIAEGEIKDLPVIIKADVQGSLEAIKASLEKLRNDEVKVNVIHAGIGGITESDVSLASASANSIILGFHIRPTGVVKEKAKTLGVEIKTYNVIYDLLDDVKAALGGIMAPVIREEDLGQAQVREVFVVPKIGAIAGCIVTDGVINRGAKVRVIRDGIIIFEGSVSSLKRFKDDVREVGKGYECGIGVVNYNDIKVGDYIESFKEIQEQASL